MADQNFLCAVRQVGFRYGHRRKEFLFEMFTKIFSIGDANIACDVWRRSQSFPTNPWAVESDPSCAGVVCFEAASAALMSLQAVHAIFAGLRHHNLVKDDYLRHFLSALLAVVPLARRNAVRVGRTFDLKTRADAFHTNIFDPRAFFVE